MRKICGKEVWSLREFTFNQSGLDKWIHQNQAKYTGAFLNGVLLDNFVLCCKRGFAAIYEYPLNEWSSCYRVEYEHGAAQEVWKRWYQFEAAAVAEVVEK
jgi:hypothetical protein